MSIMALIILIVAVMIALITFFLFIEESGEFRDYYKPIVIVLLLLGWLIFSLLTPYNGETRRILKIHEVDGAQCVSYTANFNGIILRNLNSSFARTIDTEKEDIVLIRSHGGWYKGIYWLDQYTIKIVPKGIAEKLND